MCRECPILSPAVCMCRVCPFPQPSEWTCSHIHNQEYTVDVQGVCLYTARIMDMQSVSLSIASSMDVQVVTLF
jgi:hypothetical protein